MLGQMGSTVALAVQAGLQTDDLADWPKSSGRAYYFVLAWAVVCGGVYVVFSRSYGTPEGEHQRARARVAAPGEARCDAEKGVKMEESPRSAGLPYLLPP